MSRPEKLNELLDLLLVLQNSYTGKTYDELQELYGFNRRRLERMMSVLVEQFGDKIEIVENLTDRKKHFRLKKGTINPLINFSCDDFCLLEQLKELINDNSRIKKLEELISKIKSINPKSSNSLETDIQYLLESQGYAIRQYSKENTEPKTYEIISQAILEQKKLQFDYTNSNGYKFQATIHPYGIQYWEKNYLVGFDEYSKEIIKYSISKIKNLEKLDEFFEKDENFDLKQYSEQAFGIFNSKPVKIELLFDKGVKDDVLDYHFHPTQKLKENNDGSICVTFMASGITEICWNLYKWEDKVKIIAPESLICEYKNSLTKVLNLYK